MISPEKLKVGVRSDRREWLKTLILLAMAVYFVALILTGNLTNYINLRFAWLSYVAAGILLLLGLWSVWRLRTNQPIFATGSSTNSHIPLSWGAIGVLAIPLLLAVFVPSEPLGVEAISGGISIEPIGGASAEAGYSVPPEERNVLQWLREFNNAENPAELNGQPVDIIAFIYREPDMLETQFMAARFTMSCCVADAFAIGMPVDAEDAVTLETGAWVRVRGTLQAGSFQGEQVPIIIPESIEPVEEPQNPYLYG
jgi:uncharacterized repeat protein (TIGR03943 family)